MPQNDWLIVFLIYADFRVQGLKNNEKTFRELENVLKDLKRCKISKGTKIVFVLNGIRFTKNGQVVDYTYIYQVRRGSLLCDNVFECIEVVDNKNSRNPTRPLEVNQLADIFFKIKSAINYTNERIILNTWDHGSAFGIFKQSSPTIEEAVKNEDKYPILTELLATIKPGIDEKSLRDYLKEDSQQKLKEDLVLFKDRTYYSFDLSKYLKDGIIDGYTDSLFSEIRKEINENPVIKVNDETIVLEIASTLFRNSDQLKNNIKEIELKKDGEILTNIELAEAIRTGFDKIEVLTMMNCWMMNADSLLTFKDVTNNFIAPAGDITEPGYNYLKFVNSISNEISIDEITKYAITTIPDTNNDVYRKFYLDENNPKEWFVSGYKFTKEFKSTITSFFKKTDSAFELLCKSNCEYSLKAIHFLQAMTKVSYQFNDGNTLYEQRDFLHVLNNFLTAFSDEEILIDCTKEFKDTIDDLRSELYKIRGKLADDSILKGTVHNLSVFTYENEKAANKTIDYNLSNLQLFFPANLEKLTNSLNYSVIKLSLSISNLPNMITFFEKYYK